MVPRLFCAPHHRLPHVFQLPASRPLARSRGPGRHPAGLGEAGLHGRRPESLEFAQEFVDEAAEQGEVRRQGPSTQTSLCGWRWRQSAFVELSPGTRHSAMHLTRGVFLDTQNTL